MSRRTSEEPLRAERSAEHGASIECCTNSRCASEDSNLSTAARLRADARNAQALITTPKKPGPNLENDLPTKQESRREGCSGRLRPTQRSKYRLGEEPPAPIRLARIRVGQSKTPNGVWR